MYSLFKTGLKVAQPYIIKGLKFAGEAALAAAFEKGAEKVKSRMKTPKNSGKAEKQTPNSENPAS